MRLLFFDVETKTIEETDKLKYQGFRLGTANLVNYRPDGTFTIRESFRWTQESDFHQWFDYILQDKQVLYVLSANIWFDIRNSGLFRYLMDNGAELVNFHIKALMVIIKLHYKGTTIMFLNMQQLIPVSVKKYGEMVGMEKLDVDLETKDVAKLMKYCQRDTDIITEVFRQWLEFLRTNDLGRFGLTLASQAFISYRHKFMYEKIFIHKIPIVTQFERDGYYGGRTEIFYKGRLPAGTIYGLDINSMYPGVMAENKMPVKFIKMVKLPAKIKVAYWLKKYICMGYCALDTNEPAYPLRYNKRLCFPTGRFVTFLSHPEMLYAQKHGHLVDVYYMAMYKKAFLFREYVDFFYKLKLQYGKDGNDAYRFMTKRLMNSLYGKFGQRIDGLYFEHELKEPEYSQETVYDPDTDKLYKDLRLGFNRKVFEEGTEEGIHSFTAIPAHITGLARMQLWNLIKQAGRENVFYCDTDSLFTNQTGYDNLKNETHPENMGKLSLEKQSDKVIIHGPKDYIFGETVAIKGIKKDTIPNELGGYEGLQFPGFKSDLRSGLDKPYAIRKVTKYLSRKYNKGVVGADNRVTPFELSEF